MSITSSKTTTKNAFERIKNGQSGNYKPLKTRYEHFNKISHGGIARQTIITIGGLSGFGKSHTLRELEEDVLNADLNPQSPNKVILVKVDFEMSKEEAILNRVKAMTGKPFSYLMYEEPDEETKIAFNDVYTQLSQNNVYEMYDTCTPDNLFELMDNFCTKHEDKDQIVLTIDNVNLIEQENEGETEALSKLQKNLIDLKLKHKNLSIIQLAQLNRNLKERTDPKFMFPRTSDFFNSSKIEHASDIQIVIHNPYLLGIHEYGVVSVKKFDYLEQFILPKGKWGTFMTEGLVFWHYVKVRAKDDLKTFKDVFIEKVYDAEEEENTSVEENVQDLFG
jgi:replicative DNA helicase